MSPCPSRRWSCCVPTGAHIAPRCGCFQRPRGTGLAHSLKHDWGPVTRSSLQSAFRRAVQRAGIAKRAHVHTLRHSYATLAGSGR